MCVFIKTFRSSNLSRQNQYRVYLCTMTNVFTLLPMMLPKHKHIHTYNTHSAHVWHAHVCVIRHRRWTTSPSDGIRKTNPHQPLQNIVRHKQLQFDWFLLTSHMRTRYIRCYWIWIVDWSLESCLIKTCPVYFRFVIKSMQHNLLKFIAMYLLKLIYHQHATEMHVPNSNNRSKRQIFAQPTHRYC